MYGVQGRRWVVLGVPHEPEDAWPALWVEFQRLAQAHRAEVSVYKAAALQFWRQRGLICEMIGEEAVLAPKSFALTGARRRELRRRVGRNPPMFSSRRG